MLRDLADRVMKLLKILDSAAANLGQVIVVTS